MKFANNKTIMFEALRSENIHLARYLEDLKDKSLHDYIEGIWSRDVPEISVGSDKARRYLVSGICKSHPSIHSKEILEEIRKTPVIQTGTHCQLLLSPLNFSTHIAASIGSRSQGQNVQMHYMCATLGMQGANYQGPGWLSHRGESIKLFNLSRAEMDRTFVSSRQTRSSWKFQVTPERHEPILTKLFEIIGSVSDETPEGLFIKANRKLALEIDKDGPIPIFISSSDVKNIIVNHIKDEDSLINRILFDKNFRVPIINELMGEKIQKIAPYSSGLFWVVEKGKLKKAIVEGDVIICGDRRICLSPESIINELENQSIIPTLFLDFLAISILPKIWAIGGHRQCFYLSLFYNALKRAFGTDLVSDFSGMAGDFDNQLHGWLYGLSYTDINPIDILNSTSIRSCVDEFIENIKETSLDKAIDLLPIALIDKKWSDLVLKNLYI
ncbi:hypothetical protein [uncultured Thalassospira sp.]|uniref:hypothetical protein n=1 Tax=uncultured Thalassospira sp. TaxID=404382 RepID=UPI00258A7D6F|nr:hypothetical protein [uncultured Thalassospira sp.]